MVLSLERYTVNAVDQCRPENESGRNPRPVDDASSALGHLLGPAEIRESRLEVVGISSVESTSGKVGWGRFERRRDVLACAARASSSSNLP
ncbi:hypothetical protein EA473_14175 [Natrarchaeobius chitinivorans]|uniref:Uncharacterized protein n=1 Tax=Natrarchaeobius chitinivorans TaxID=1679083 RepID=A0A3N6LUC7_NATCH|nr:hypothetical protein EA473_14175 [Natrarchaeobius chitinivorans]